MSAEFMFWLFVVIAGIVVLYALIAEVQQEAARISELERDAARYRFVRDADRSECISREISLYALDSLDEYVDAAMEDEAAMKEQP